MASAVADKQLKSILFIDSSNLMHKEMDAIVTRYNAEKGTCLELKKFKTYAEYLAASVGKHLCGIFDWNARATDEKEKGSYIVESTNGSCKYKLVLAGPTNGMDIQEFCYKHGAGYIRKGPLDEVYEKFKSFMDLMVRVETKQKK